MIVYEWNDGQRELLQNQLFSKSIFKINGRHLYQCSVDEMKKELWVHREVKVDRIQAIEKKA
ncbi:MAG TPA: hypothetical protein DDY49_12505 [Paenibacillaceae bacterium]|nr:hypothetical protein [Paenibacillaceae bacterium]